MTKQECKQIQDEATAVLKAHFESKNIAVKFTGGKYSNSVELKFEFVPEGGQNREAEAFTQQARFYGLLPENLGQCFTTFGGETYEITGLNTRRTKNPVTAKSFKNGKTYVFPVAAVSAYLAAKK